MNWRRIATAGVVLLCSLGLAGCELVSVNTEREAEQVVLRVGEKTYTQGEINESFDPYLQSQGADPADPAMQDSILEWKKTQLEAIAKREVMNEEAVAQGYMDKLSEEELAEVDRQYQELLDSFEARRQELEEEYAEDPEKDSKIQEALDQEKQEFLDSNQYESLEEYKEFLKKEKAAERYQADLENAIAVSDDDIAAEYQKLMNEQKGSFDNDPSAYFSADGTHVYAPEGIRNIRQILIKFPEAIESAISELNAQKQTLESEGDVEGAAEVQTQIDEKKKQGLPQIQSKADEVLRKAKNGTDFDALIEQYNEDEGMKSNPKGYPAHASVTTQYVTEFQDAAMALPSVGAISDLVATNFGYHILLYASDQPAGEVPLEQIKETLREELLESKKSSAVEDKQNELFEQYQTEGKLEIYPDRLKKASVPGK